MQRSLAISCEQIECEQLLNEWRWLVPVDATPLQIGIFGDMIFGAPDGSLWHLDLIEGIYHKISLDYKNFNEKKQDQKYLDEWFGADWANIALESGLTPKQNECLGWMLAPVLGGAFSVTNIAVFSLRVYLSATGQLFRHLSHGQFRAPIS